MGEDQLHGVAFAESYSYLLPRLGATFTRGAAGACTPTSSRGGREPAFRDIYDPQDYWSQRVDARARRS